MRFAHGVNEITVETPNSEFRCSCPATEAGASTATTPTGDYDTIMKMVSGEKCGVVKEREAKEAWFKAMQIVDEDPSRDDWEVSRMESVAERLGWENGRV